MIPVQEIRDPEQIDPPDRIGDELARGKRQRLAVHHDGAPRHGSPGRLGVALDVRQLAGGDARMRGRRSVSLRATMIKNANNSVKNPRMATISACAVGSPAPSGWLNP